MMMSKNINDQLVELYSVNCEKLKSHTASFINETRDEAIRKFSEYGLPTKKDENYKYSNISKWVDGKINDVKVNFDFNVVDDCSKNIKIEQNSNGVLICDLNTFAAEYSDIFEKYYTKSTEDDSLMMLSRAFASGGRVIYVPRKAVCNELITIESDSCNSELSLGVRDIFIFEKDTLAKIHIIHNQSGVMNRVCEIFVESGANIEISEEIYGTEESIFLNTMSVSQKKDSFYKHVSLNLSEGKVRCSEYVTLGESGAEASIFGAVSAKKSAHIDNQTVVKHMVENCSSYENFKYVANDTATASFVGNVFVAAQANGTKAYQQNNNILLSDTANIYSKPNLEIYADDVKCSHGATVGQLDETAIFYMRQRGIDIIEAKKLLLKGFLKDIVDKISSVDIVDKLSDKLSQNI